MRRRDEACSPVRDGSRSSSLSGAQALMRDRRTPLTALGRTSRAPPAAAAAAAATRGGSSLNTGPAPSASADATERDVDRGAAVVEVDRGAAVVEADRGAAAAATDMEFSKAAADMRRGAATTDVDRGAAVADMDLGPAGRNFGRAATATDVDRRAAVGAAVCEADLGPVAVNPGVTLSVDHLAVLVSSPGFSRAACDIPLSSAVCTSSGAAWPGTAWPGAAWPGAAWPGVTWPRAVWPGVIWPGATWPGARTEEVAAAAAAAALSTSPVSNVYRSGVGGCSPPPGDGSLRWLLSELGELTMMEQERGRETGGGSDVREEREETERSVEPPLTVARRCFGSDSQPRRDDADVAVDDAAEPNTSASGSESASFRLKQQRGGATTTITTTATLTLYNNIHNN